MGMTVTKELITVEKAKGLKASSRGNRNISRSRVQAYARDMKSGNWQDNGETIVIDSMGHLRDGHHRIEAIIESGVPVKMLVVRGVETDVTVFDVGRSRSCTDIVAFIGADKHLFSKGNYAIARLHFSLERGSTYSPSYLELTRFIEAHKDTFTALDQVSGTSRSGSATYNFVLSAPYRYVMLCAYENGVPVETISRFTGVVRSQMTFVETESCALILSRMIQNSPNVSLRNAQGRAKAVALVDTAFRGFVNDVKRSTNFDWRYVKRSYFIKEETSESRD